MVFLSNYLVFKIVLAALGRTDYPVAGDLELKYDNANKIYLSGGSLDYIDDFTLWTTIGEETTSYDGGKSLNLDISNEKILLADDRDTDTQLGYGCDIDGDYMIGGAPQDDEGGSQAGAAYIFKRSAGSWKQTAKLVASDAAASDQAAEFCEISGDYAIYGAYSKNSSAGAAYIFKRDTGAETWSQQSKLTASDAASSDGFGWGVSIDGDYAIVGAYGEDTGYTGAGAAYIFKRSGTSWSEEAKIQADNAGYGDYFGYDVTISGDYAAVGAIYEDTTASEAGSVYIFKRSGTNWTQQQRIQSSDIASNDNFGSAVAMDGDYLAVSAAYDNSNVGAVYFFKKDDGAETWTQQTKIIPSGATTYDYVGQIGSLSISGDTVVVGADRHDTGGTSDAGTAWVFKRSGTTWSEVKKLSASDKGSGYRFGISVGVSGNTVLVGSAYADQSHANNGALYVYDPQVIKNYYINEVGKYSADVTIAGLKYKTNEVDVTSLNIPAKVVSVNAGYRTCAAITEDGSVYMWGSGSSGRLAQGSSDTNDKNTPVQVKGVDGVGFLSNIKQVSIGGTQVLALANDGTLYAWGDNGYGQLGVGDNTSRYYPTVVPYSGEAISKIHAGHKHSLICTVTNGYVYACGENQRGQVGDGSNGSSSSGWTSFSQVINYVGNSGGTYISGITHLASGNDFSIVLNATTGLAYGFGEGSHSQLSTGDTTIINNTPREVKTGGSTTNLTNIANISCGEDFSYFLIDDGTVYASGEGSAGEQGDGANSDNTSASACTGLSNIVDILGTKTCGFARKSDGTLYVWGDNTHGQFANGSASTGDTHTPTAITSITGVEEISAYGRGENLIARKSDGSVWCWGEGAVGSIGNGVDSNASSPTQVIPGAGPSVDGKFNLFTSPSLVFDNYNKLSINHGLKGTSSKLFLGSNVYDIGTLTSDLTIETPGLYKSLIYDTSSNVAYFSKTTVSAVASGQKDYALEQKVYGTQNSSSPSQGGFGGYIDMNGDGTRMVTGMGTDPSSGSYCGRAKVFHLENGTWTLKVDIPTTNSGQERFGETVAMNENGTRIAVSFYNNDQILIYDYAGGSWPTTPTKTISGENEVGRGGIDMNKAGTVLVVGTGTTDDKAHIYTRASDTGNWSLTKTWSGSDHLGSAVAMNGAGTRVLIGQKGTGDVWEGNYDESSSSWGSLTKVIDTSYSDWPDRIRMDSDGTTAVIVDTTSSEGGIYERQSGSSWTLAHSVSGYSTPYAGGCAISYDGTMVLVGDVTYGANSSSSPGRAYLHKYSGGSWSLTNTIVNPTFVSNSDTEQYWGAGVAIAKNSKSRYAIGMPYDGTAGTSHGSVYVYNNVIPDYISFDTYNKLTLSGLTNPTSKIHALPTGAESTTTYDIGTATNMYIESAGTYTAEMKGSSAFAIDSNVVTGTITESPIKQVSSGGLATMALTNDGHVYMWGDDEHGHLGQGTSNTSKNTPVKVKGVGGSGFLSNITKISCGLYHAIALASDGTLYAWGDNAEGQCGDGTNTDRTTPVVVSYSGDAVSNIAAGGYHSALTTTTGKVYCWGQGTSGEIGNNGNNDVNTPQNVKSTDGTGSLTGIRDVSCGEQHTRAVKDSDGSVYSWGKNYYGALGDGTNGSGSNKNYPVSTIIAGGSAVTGITQLSSGGDYALMLKSDGTVYACGYGGLGQQGDNSTDDNNVGLVQVQGVGGSGNLEDIVQIAAANATSLALKNDGTMYSWGSNQDGQNGLGTVGGTNPTTPVEITLLTGVDTISADGLASHFAVTKSDGSVYCWGQGGKGQIGDGTNTADQGTPTQVLAGAGPSDGGKFNLNTAPKLKFDGLNKYTFSGADTGSTYKLKYLSNTYDLGTTSKVYIKDTGTYSAEIKGATNFALVSNVVSGTVSFPSRTSYRYLALAFPRNQYENSLENMIIEFDDGTKYDNANQPASSAFTQNYAPSTGATTDVFSTSQNTNWNGNSLGWNDGTWYCPFHIDFGSGFTKKVKRVTIINRINDYQYSLIVPRLYGASSVPSTPGLAANWNYVCHVESIQKDWTSTLTSYDMEPKAYRYIGLAGYRTVYSMHVYEFSIELVDGTVYDSSNKPTVSSDLSVSGGSVANTIDGDWTNNANWDNASSHTSASQQYVYLKVDLGSAKRVKHVRIWNQYTGTYTNSTNSMNYYGSSTNTSSTDAEGSSDWNRLGPIEMLKSNDATEKTINSSLYDSKLEFDTYNKLSLSTFDPISTKLTSGENTYDIGTATNIYISENGTYDAEVTSASALAFTSNVVTGSVTQSTDYKLLHDPNTESSFPSYTITNGTNRSSNDAKYLFYPLETSSGTTTLDVWENTTSSTYGEITLTYPQNIIVSNVVVQCPSRSNVPNAFPQTAELFTSIDNSNYTSHGTVSMTNNFPDLYVITVSNPVTSKYVRVKIDNGNTEGLGRIHVHGLESVSPSLTFDTYNKLSINDITPTSSTLKYGSNTYDIGSATNVYIKDTGTYNIEAKNASTFALASNVSSGTIKTIEPALSGGHHGAHALTYDGKLYAWGRNTAGTGELGVGDANNRSVPTLCTGITQGQVAKFLDFDGLTHRSYMTWVKTTDNKIYATGRADYNQIPGHTSDLNTFTDVTSHFGDQSLSANNIIQVSTGATACAGLTETGNVWTWGQNDGTRGNLGNGGTTSSTQAVPAQITINGATDNITKLANGHDFTIALDNESNVWLWGTEWLGSTWGSASPIKMGTALDSITITDISASYSSMYAISNTGVLYASGNGGDGRIMDGGNTDVSSSSNPDWKEVTYFSSNNITVNKVYPGTQYVGGGYVDTSDGWYAFGGNSEGTLGLGDTTNRLSPVKFTGVSNIKKFAVGYSTSYAVTEDGKYYAWGDGYAEARGDNDSSDISYPKYIDKLPNILAPSFDFDGYDKIASPSIFLPGTSYRTYVNSIAINSGASGWTSHTYNYKRTETDTPGGSGADGTAGIGDGEMVWVYGRSDAMTNVGYDIAFKPSLDTWYDWYEVGQSSYPNMSSSADSNGRVGDEIKLTMADGSSAAVMTCPYKGKTYYVDYNVKFTKGTTTYDTGEASIVTVPDPGTYDAQLTHGDTFSLKSTTIPATKASGLYTWAFHHGNFDNAYGDGDILTARDNGRFYADTPSYTGAIGTITPGSSTTSNTTYTFTPASSLTSNVLMVAGGGGGGGVNGGGGGAGGLVYSLNESISTGSKTIVVGNGGKGGTGYNTGSTEVGIRGNDTTFLSYTASGGGGGGTQDSSASTQIDGGSGGGNNKTYDSGLGGTSTQNAYSGKGFGNDGGNGAVAQNSDLNGGGGGGAGGAGGIATGANGTAGAGGIGKYYGNVFGTNYGDDGWFAGGGGGSTQTGSNSTVGLGGKGGGGDGFINTGTNDKSYDGQTHTGGGAGAAGYSASNSTQVGGNGSSGIVLLQTNVPTPNVNNEVKVSDPDGFLTFDVDKQMIGRGPIKDSHTGRTILNQPLPNGNEGPVYYNSGQSHYHHVSTHDHTHQGDGSFQTAESVFMPIETGNYTHIASLMHSDSNLMTLGIDSNNKLIIQHNNDQNHNSVTTLVTSDYTMEHGKWHHLVLTTDYLGNAKAYVNGYLVTSGQWTSMNSDKSQAMFHRIGVDNHAERVYMASTSRAYFAELSHKEIMQLASSVGLGPKLEYDGFNTLKILNTEPGSTVRLFTSNVADTSNVFIVADPADNEYTIPEAGKYYAEIKGTDTFTITKTIDVSGTFPLYQYPPVVTGTKSSLTSNITAGGSFYNNFWTMSGAPVGNGQYRAKTSHATNAPGSTDASVAGLFTNLAKIESITEGGTTHYGFLHTSTTSNFDITLQLPSAKIIRKYVLYPADTHAPVSTPGGSVDPTLPGNGSEENTRRPKSWVLKGSNNDVDWTTIHTVTNKPPSIYGDVHTISSPASYLYYMLSISANNGSSSTMQLGEWQLWGDA